jgi:hypothetical protein
MTVQVHGTSWMTSDRTTHRAKGVGQGNWVVSYLPGRTLTLPQAVAALRIAEEVRPVVTEIGELSNQFGLTALEAITLALAPCDWPDPPPDPTSWRRLWPARRRWWLR